MNLLDEVLDHLFGHVEVSNNTVTHRADRLDRSWRPAKHQLRVFPNGQYILFAISKMIRNHRRLIQNNAFAFDINQRVRRA